MPIRFVPLIPEAEQTADVPALTQSIPSAVVGSKGTEVTLRFLRAVRVQPPPRSDFPGFFPCVSRCARRARLCGEDADKGKPSWLCKI